MFTAIINQPGYLPESEPQVFDNKDDAELYLIEQLTRHHDDTAGSEWPANAEEVKAIKDAEKAFFDAIADIHTHGFARYHSYVYEIING